MTLATVYLFVGVVVFGNYPDHTQGVHHGRNGFYNDLKSDTVYDVFQMSLDSRQKPAHIPTCSTPNTLYWTASYHQ